MAAEDHGLVVDQDQLLVQGAVAGLVRGIAVYERRETLQVAC